MVHLSSPGDARIRAIWSYTRAWVCLTSLVRIVSTPMSCGGEPTQEACEAREPGRERKRKKREDARVNMRRLLLGPPLNDRGGAYAADPAADLNQWMHAIEDFIPQIGGDNETAKQARMEFEQFARFPATFDGVMCKRAALLFAALHEKEVGAMLHGPGVEDMLERVLPFTCPRYLKQSCQTPDTFVVLSLVLNEMWRGERMGNWPRRVP